MFKQSLISVLFWTVVCAPVSGQESGVLADPMRPQTQASSGAATAPSYRVSVVFISPSTRVAVINGKLSREGDSVDGAQILSIDAGVVHIRTESREFPVYLGSNTAPARSSDPAVRVSSEPVSRQSLSEPDFAAGSAPPEAHARFDTYGRHGPVKRGETLSGIAQHYLSDGVTMDQMMIALFDANPRAFSGNINVLHEGAVLLIPSRSELGNQAPAVATAEVARHRIDWWAANQQQVRTTNVPVQENYGPVNRGETLSEIAQDYLRDGVTMNQMMIAMFQTNPQAFSGNINVLREGAVLRIPDGNELRNQVPETATAEVVRQTDEWRTGAWRQARLTSSPGHYSVEVSVYEEYEMRVAEVSGAR